MICHDFHIQHLVSVFFLFLQEEFFEASIEGSDQYLAPIFWAKHNMILAAIDQCARMMVLFASLCYIHICLPKLLIKLRLFYYKGY